MRRAAALISAVVLAGLCAFVAGGQPHQDDEEGFRFNTSSVWGQIYQQLVEAGEITPTDPDETIDTEADTLTP